MMNKISSEGIPCAYCDEPAIPGTEPPACAKHAGLAKKAGEERPETLKELDSAREDVDAGGRV